MIMKKEQVRMIYIILLNGFNVWNFLLILELIWPQEVINVSTISWIQPSASAVLSTSVLYAMIVRGKGGRSIREEK